MRCKNVIVISGQALTAVMAMTELSLSHTEFLEHGVTIKEEEELIRKFIATGSLG